MGHRLSVLIALALATWGCAQPVLASPAASTRLPAVEVATLAGEQVELGRVAGGRVALVSLWATWCEGCTKEIDALNRLHARAGAGVVVIGVAVGEERTKVADFARSHGLWYTLVVDPEFAFADAIGQRRVPATLVVDRQGVIVFRGDALDAAGIEALGRAMGGGGEAAREARAGLPQAR